MTTRPLFDDDPIAQGWSPQTRRVYLAFTRRLTAQGPLTVRIGKGGLSYYKSTSAGPVFVCHFNGAPRANDSQLGFADFRFEGLKDRLDLGAVLTAFQTAAQADIQVKLNRRWCSIHFPLKQSAKIADLFREQIVAKVR